MIQAFRRFTEAIRGDDSRGLVQGYLRPIDTDLVARKLKIDLEAAERGARNQPAADFEAFDFVEQNIVQNLESEWTFHGSELLNNLRAYNSRLIAVSVQTELANLDLLAKNTLSQLRDANHRAEANLGPLREDFLSYRDELSSFRQKHKLKRATRNPARRWTTFGLLILLIGIEFGPQRFFLCQRVRVWTSWRYRHSNRNIHGERIFRFHTGSVSASLVEPSQFCREVCWPDFFGSRNCLPLWSSWICRTLSRCNCIDRRSRRISGSTTYLA